MNGWVIIGTELDTKPLDKKLRKLESSLENQEIDLKIKAENIEEAKRQLKEVEIAMKNISKNNKESKERLKSLTKQYETFNKRIAEGDHLTTEEYRRHGRLTNDIAKLQSSQEKVNKEMDKYNSKFNKLYDSLNKAEVSYDKQKNRVEETKQQIIDLNNQIKKNNLQEIQDRLKKAEKSTENIVKKVLRWGLALFSIRSGYMFIRQAMSTLSQYNEKIGVDIEYIRWALANTLKPIIEYIMTLAQKLVAYVIYIGKAWGLISKEADFSAKAFDKARKSIAGANKQAKELRKTLAGFDEMNILNENGSVGSLGSSNVMPSFDLGKMEDIPIPSWVKWIAENGTTVAIIIGSIGAAIAGLKLAELVTNLEKAGIHVLGLFDRLSKMSGLQIFGMVAGFAVTIVGIVETISSLITFINDPSWENFVGVLSGLETILIGVGIAMVAFNATNPVGWITLAIGLIGKLVTELGKDEKKTLDLTEAKKKLNNAEKEFVNAQSRYTTAIKNRDQALKDLQKAEKNTKLSGEDLYKSVMTGKLKFDDMTKTQQSVYLAYVKYKGTINDVETATKDLQNEEHELILASLEEQATIAATKNDFEDFSKTLNNLVDKGTISVEEAYKIINNIFGKMEGLGKDVFGTQFPKYFSSSTDSAEKLRKKVQDLYNQYKKLKDLGFPSTSGSSYSSKSVWAKGGVLTYAKGGVYKPIKLASGAIVNQPGRGVPIGHNAIAGEHGAEGIIPLTDSQQMDLLGSAIARRVVINLTNITQMNARTISRELKQVQSEDDFAFNR